MSHNTKIKLFSAHPRESCCGHLQGYCQLTNSFSSEFTLSARGSWGISQTSFCTDIVSSHAGAESTSSLTIGSRLCGVFKCRVLVETQARVGCRCHSYLAKAAILDIFPLKLALHFLSSPASGAFNFSCAHDQYSAKWTETNIEGEGGNQAEWTGEPEREPRLEESTMEQEGNEEAERKRWSQQCHAGRKALPWHFANQREG